MHPRPSSHTTTSTGTTRRLFRFSFIFKCILDVIVYHELDSPEVTLELNEYTKTSVTMLLAFFALQSISGSHYLAAVTLALVLYTSSLQWAIKTPSINFLKDLDPYLFTLIYAIPGLGIFTITCIELVQAVDSLAIMACVVVCSCTPIVVVFVQHIRSRLNEAYGQAEISVETGRRTTTGVNADGA